MSDLSPEIVELAPQAALVVRGDMATADLPQFFQRGFPTVAAAAETAGVEIVGPPFAFYPEMPSATVAIEAGFPVSKLAESGAGAHSLVLPGGRAVQVLHVGPYETMKETYVKLQSWMDAQGLQPASGMWESYLSDPQAEPDPSTWRTMIIWPVI